MEESQGSFLPSSKYILHPHTTGVKYNQVSVVLPVIIIWLQQQTRKRVTHEGIWWDWILDVPIYVLFIISSNILLSLLKVWGAFSGGAQDMSSLIYIS
jgi:hypothetical protein